MDCKKEIKKRAFRELQDSIRAAELDYKNRIKYAKEDRDAEIDRAYALYRFIVID